MGWWEAITTHRRAIKSICVRFERGELRVSICGLRPGERTAALIDHLTNRVHLFESFPVCQQLLEKHRYEIATDESEPLQVRGGNDDRKAAESGDLSDLLPGLIADGIEEHEYRQVPEAEEEWEEREQSRREREQQQQQEVSQTEMKK